MKRRIISILAAVLIVLVAFPADALAAPPGGVPPGQTAYAADEIVVGFKPGTTLPQMALVHRQAGGYARHTIPALGAQVVGIPAGTVGNSIKRYASHPLVAYAEPNYIAEALGEPDDTYLDEQWGLEKVQAATAWDTTTGSTGVTIAILDTGVDTDHPDLRDKIVDSINFSASPTADDVYGHGTHVAGIAAADTNNTMGVAGLGYQSSIMNVKVLRDNGSGYHSWIADGIVWATDSGANVINLSLGGGESSQLLEDAVNYAWKKGVVVVAAAGNHGNSYPVYPAAYANCMAVAATDQNDDRPSWSAYGDWVAVAAPGTGIYSTIPDDGYAYKAGTSMASPHVAGLAALVFTGVTDLNGDGLLNEEVRARIEATCDDIGVSGIGSGRINAYQAVVAEGSEPEPEPEPQPGVQIALSADPASVSQAGDVIDYTYTVSNTGTVTLTGIAVTDDLLGNIPLGTTTLAPDTSTTGMATYTVTQADIDLGADIVNTATVTCEQGVTHSASTTISIVQDVAVQIALSADPTSVSQAGDVVTYTYTVSNTGQVTLTGITVTDDMLGGIALSSTTLAPTASTSATATYTVTQSDIDNGTDIVNTATVTCDQGVTHTASTTVTIDVPEVSGVSISPPESSDRAWAGQDVLYVFTVQNTGNVPDTYDVSLTSAWLSSAAPQSLALDPGATETITVTHSVPVDASPGDFDTGTVQVLSGGTGASASPTFTTTARVAAVQIAPAQQSATAAPGETVHYIYTISNTGTEDDVYSLAVSAGWAASLSATSLSVEAGASAEVIVSHTVPDGAAGGDADTGSLTATSTWARAAAAFTTTAEPLRQPSAPVIDLFTVSDRSNPAWAWVTVDWAVSDEDGDLASVEVVMVLDGTIVDSVTTAITGYDASGSCELRCHGGQGGTYEIVLSVTDAAGNTTSQTQTMRSQEKTSPRSR